MNNIYITRKSNLKVMVIIIFVMLNWPQPYRKKDTTGALKI